ncbi:hypothetical protein Pcinc_003131 [Petrolisthes cinctipes]|uniref:DNA excision repair protein ERCC-1 n=1 Tax=Petrolisthes cinctipes TaxID=88211 RepID=A0AAE1GGW6_PETCI|nr:hypothetical protein Pcinc_003131 [Petrolisthes cinctipes]
MEGDGRPQKDVATSSTDTAIKSGYINVSSINKQDGNATSSAFSKVFSNLKKSEFYEEPPPEVKSIVAAGDQTTTTTTNNKPASKFSVVVSSRQRGNPILKSIRNVPWEYGEIVPDYVMGGTTCALFLSLRYHNLNPNYIHDRLKLLGRQYQLRVLLVLVDIKDPHHELKQLTKICVLADMTLMLAWNQEEAGRIIEVYKMFEHKPPDLIMEKQDHNPHSMAWNQEEAGRIIEVYKMFEHKPPDLIMEKQDHNPHSMLIDALTTVRSVNRTDAMTLLSTFVSLERIIEASEEEMALCPGFGPQKAKRLHRVLHQHFRKPQHQKKSELVSQLSENQKKSQPVPQSSEISQNKKAD